ncbi:MAG: sporulation protein YunB [Clostridiales bacterium]|jgi:sporulation protein YunB|nr:sporulation protein YunB [Clostridiales bacterium]
MPRRGFLRAHYPNAYFGLVIGKKKKRVIKLIVSGILLIALIIYLAAKIRPLVVSMAGAAVKNAVTMAINEAVKDKMASGDFDYMSLISLEKDDTGQITALVANMVHINTLQANITNLIIEKIREERTSELSIPIGNIIGGSLLSGRGPEINIRILSVSSASSKFINSFTTSGINQTRHQIILEATVAVSVLVPSAITTVPVSTQLLIAESVIVGRVPDSYMYFEGSENWDTNLEKFDILH